MSSNNGKGNEDDIIPPQLDEQQTNFLNTLQLQLATLQLDATMLVLRGQELMEFGRVMNERIKQLLETCGLEPSIHLLDKLIPLDGEDK